MNKLILIAQIICLFSYSHAQQQYWAKADGFIDYSGRAITSGIRASEPSDEILETTGLILTYLGLSLNIKVLKVEEGYIPYVAAKMEDGQRYVLYNHVWVEGTKSKKEVDWTVTIALAHEIGHHIYNHNKYSLSKKIEYNHETELEADYYSGQVLALMGATRDDAEKVIGLLVPNQESTKTHPSLVQRRNAVIRGWENICAHGQDCDRNFQQVEGSFRGTDMVLVHAGSFIMGSKSGGDSDEDPPTRQRFDEPFWIDKTEVTKGAYNRCVLENECTPPTKDEDPKTDDQPNQPRNYVTWYQATTYCNWRGARLPTEAEWEYAARGPEGFIYPWGNEFDENKVHYADNSAEAPANVGSYPSGESWVGALDMSGNLWEWTRSLYEDYKYKGEEVELIGNETNIARTKNIVLRGGGFTHSQHNVRAANRDIDSADGSERVVGFRCARSIPLL